MLQGAAFDDNSQSLYKVDYQQSIIIFLKKVLKWLINIQLNGRLTQHNILNAQCIKNMMVT